MLFKHNIFIIVLQLGAIISAAPYLVESSTVAPSIPPPPEPEPVKVVELPLPPVTSNDEAGSCDSSLNPRKTGCILRTAHFESGSFLPDGKHVLAYVEYAGAPPAPDPASIFHGSQIIIVKTDGSHFPNGDSWKCLTCGLPAENAVGRTEAMDYPQSFVDGKRALVGTNILDCGQYSLASVDCTPKHTFLYPIHWTVTPDGSGPSGSIRELRLHPDNVHLGFSSFATLGGMLTQYGYFSRLQFNQSPKSGLPLSPRYDLVNVTRLYNPDSVQPISVKGNNLVWTPSAISVGELRGFTGRGKEITYVGYPDESSNLDVYAADLKTGAVRRLTSHPEYVDPIDFSPDDEWFAIMDTRGTDRQMFISGMRNIPPITDLLSTSITSATRNNGHRRFFQPYLVDRWGDRGSYYGQKINGPFGIPGSGAINDPEWNGRADPRWSPDATKLVYWEALTVFPDCGGSNPLPCYNSTADGGRVYRMMMANFTSRTPKILPPVAPVSDVVPWGVPYLPGDDVPERPQPAPGVYTLKGKLSGLAEVTFTNQFDLTSISSVAVRYNNFSNDGETFLEGFENVTSQSQSATLNHIDWYSDLQQKGNVNATKKTSPNGFHLTIDVLVNKFDANGTLTTVVNGKIYTQPINGG
ncbi:saponin hydrolase precursor [Colletotrichum truncatum]|uniref:Saponin hydrolase n=1 Tax=Colletotrichum truncatum TaxID=5467 RepID=A0ACC3ZK61_COLTU|nr:saponin hydrolase precursor [Colletotrichum truncatum]KAF6799882.1 saponin hydrolase precursor [Colletotrichum truncatum]